MGSATVKGTVPTKETCLKPPQELCGSWDWPEGNFTRNVQNSWQGGAVGRDSTSGLHLNIWKASECDKATYVQTVLITKVASSPEAYT